ncbi:anti-sigma B factor RsbW [Shimazuella alba]|jgi:serine/threonine-protein kinase RsbW|uniref:Anti-sigma B factor RsbW n=1 Tax=Shimazuella alba TaxID=2690964 RepID=A0A6I4VNR5_9BACL|nr:anti-sigma B factor RsbW [Shimazuella alba]MXQ52673.1 anti-sigma B factor RsbW [Shimazuella alba]
MKEQPLDLVNLVIPAKTDFVGIARLAVSGIANRMGFSYDDIEDLKLAVSEACTNAVDAQYTDGEGDIKVCCNIFSNRLEIEVMDQCLYDDDLENPAIKALREQDLGLYLIESLMDQVDVQEEGGVVVKLTKFIKENGVKEHAGSPASYPT